MLCRLQVEHIQREIKIKMRCRILRNKMYLLLNGKACFKHHLLGSQDHLNTWAGLAYISGTLLKTAFPPSTYCFSEHTANVIWQSPATKLYVTWPTWNHDISKKNTVQSYRIIFQIIHLDADLSAERYMWTRSRQSRSENDRCYCT